MKMKKKKKKKQTTNKGKQTINKSIERTMKKFIKFRTNNKTANGKMK